MKTDIKNKNLHEKELGYTVPEGYFEKSKAEILNKVKTDTKVRRLNFSKNKIIIWSTTVAAITLLSLPFMKLDMENLTSDSIVNNSKILLPVTISEHQAEDLLLASLFTKEKDMDAIVEAYMIEE
ncbi:hypothetical protein ACFLSU_04600 [Bacteroidota bacterium]